VTADRERMGPPPVEGLSDVTWQRVERGLFASLDCDAAVAEPAIPARRRAWQPWALAGGLAVACTAAALLLVRPAPSGGGASAADAGAGPAPARVVTQDASTEVTFGDATITVDAESAVTMHGDLERGVLIVLERGAAAFAVAPRDGRPPFVVQAGEVTVRVIGTRFEVSRSGDAARVDVTEGHVEVVARGRRVQVRAGDSWASNGDREAVVRGQVTGPGEVAAAPFLESSSDEEEAGLPLGGRQPRDGEPGDGRPSDGLPWEGQSSAGAVAVSPEVASREASRDAEPATARPRPRQRTSRSDVPDLDRARFERAAALERKDARAALAEYQAIAGERGRWAANALYAAGRLAAELRDPAAAALLGTYLRRYPRGGNAADARTLLDQLEE
jgi:hypothetical protein